MNRKQIYDLLPKPRTPGDPEPGPLANCITVLILLTLLALFILYLYIEYWQ